MENYKNIIDALKAEIEILNKKLETATEDEYNRIQGLGGQVYINRNEAQKIVGENEKLYVDHIIKLSEHIIKLLEENILLKTTFEELLSETYFLNDLVDKDYWREKANIK